MFFFLLFLVFFKCLGFCTFFWDIWVLRDPTFSANKNKNKKKTFVKRLSKGTLNTCAKFQVLTLKSGVDIWTYVRLSAKITAWHCNYLVLAFIRFWALNLWLNIDPTQSALRFFARNFVQTCLGAPGSGWSGKKSVIFFSSYSKCLSIFDLFEGLWHIFDTSASPRSLTNKMAMSPSSTGHGGQHDAKICVIRVANACGILGGRNLGFYAWTSSY